MYVSHSFHADENFGVEATTHQLTDYPPYIHLVVQGAYEDHLPNVYLCQDLTIDQAEEVIASLTTAVEGAKSLVSGS